MYQCVMNSLLRERWKWWRIGPVRLAHIRVANTIGVDPVWNGTASGGREDGSHEPPSSLGHERFQAVVSKQRPARTRQLPRVTGQLTDQIAKTTLAQQVCQVHDTGCKQIIAADTR